MTKRALLCLDLINDIVHPEGKLAQAKGYADYIAQHNSLNTIARIQDQFRQAGALVVHTRVGFSEGYPELNADSPLFGGLPNMGALQLSTWGTDLHSDVDKEGNEPALTKHRVSPFYRTRLDLILSTQHVEDLYICGCATNLAVASAARDAHDRDYNVTILADACIAENEELHNASLANLQGVATIANFADVALKLAA